MLRLCQHRAFTCVQCGFLRSLAEAAGIALETVAAPGRGIRPRGSDAPAADIATRPQPHSDFVSAPDLLPSLLMVWDFCQSYRLVHLTGLGALHLCLVSAELRLGRPHAGSCQPQVLECLQGSDACQHRLEPRFEGRMAAGPCCGCRPSPCRAWRQPSWTRRQPGLRKTQHSRRSRRRQPMHQEMQLPVPGLLLCYLPQGQ